MNENYRELTSEELEQVNGGFTIGNASISKARQGRGGSTVTADNRFEAIAGFTCGSCSRSKTMIRALRLRTSIPCSLMGA